MPAPQDYVDVAERIRQFKEAYPDGSLQMWSQPELMAVGDKTYIRYIAAAYRSPDDKMPGIGCAWEPVPGPTPFTRDSELMNAETSAWGRAIVALGFETKKIASADEVRNRQAAEETIKAEVEPQSFKAPPERPQGAAERPVSPDTLRVLKETVEALQKGFPSPDQTHSYWNDVQNYMKATFGVEGSKELTEQQAQVVILEFENRLAMASTAEQTPIG